MATTTAMSELDRDTAARWLVAHACRRGFAIAFDLLGNRADAEDALQEALARSVAGLDRLRDPGALEGWFLRVLSNLCVRALRRRRVIDTIVGILGARGEPVVEAAGVERDHARMLAEIALLPPMQRAALVLRHGHDLGIDEIADLLEIGAETVKTHLKRARARLRERLGVDDEA